MREDQKPATTAQALVKAVFKVRPSVFAESIKFDMKNNCESVTMTFAVRPELIKAWEEECSEIGKAAP